MTQRGRATVGGSLLLAASACLAASAGALAAPSGLPEVKLPPTPSLPKAPQLPAPRVDLPRPQLPSAPGGGSGGSGGGGGATGSPAVGGLGGGPSGNIVTEVLGGAAGGVVGGAPAARAEQHADERRAASRRLERRRSHARERRFRLAVRHLEPCLYGVSDFHRRVLSLRAGLAGTRARSRAYVAWRLRVSSRRVKRTELGALRDLRSVDRVDGCTSSPAAAQGRHWATEMSAFIAVAPLEAVAARLPRARRVRLAAAPVDRQQVLGQRSSSSPQTDGPTAAALDADNGSGDGGPSFPLLAALLLSLVAGTLVARHRRRLAGAGSDADGKGKVGPAPWTSNKRGRGPD